MGKNGFKVMDSDMHIAEPTDLWVRYMEPQFRDQAPVGIDQFLLDFGLAIGGKPISGYRTFEAGSVPHPEMRAGKLEQDPEMRSAIDAALERDFDPVSQLDAMDREGVNLTVLFPSRGLAAEALEYEDMKLAAAVARAYNNWLGDFCKKDPARLYGAAMLSVHDVEEAVVEARRAKEELGFVAVFLRPNPVRGRNWHDPAYDPLWEACQLLELAVCFHEGQDCLLPQAVAERFNNEPDHLWTMAHVADHPMEMMYASLCFTAGGVLERFPRLRVGFLEANCSWVPYWLWRIDEHNEARGRTLPLKPSEYFLRQCFVSVESEEELCKYVIDWMGDDNIVFSTDYPHIDSLYPRAMDRFLSLPLSEESRRKILWDNCIRLYGF